MVEVVKFYIFLLYAGFMGKSLGIGLQKGKLFIILVSSLFASYLSFLKFIPFSPFIFFIFLSLPVVFFIKRKGSFKIEKEDILSEALFFIIFIFGIFVRMYSPAIFGAEKPMEFAFITSLSRTIGLPPYDPWLLGYLNPYYYFGFVSPVFMAKLLHISNEIMFNLFSPFIFAISGSIIFEILYEVTRKITIGLLGTVITLFMANYERLWAIFRHKKLIDYWSSSRVIPNTINEFPLFSFIHGDNHPHYIFLPIGILGLYLIWKEDKPFILAFTIFIYIINPWAVPFFFFLWVAKKYIEHGFKTEDIIDILFYYVGALILSLPFLYTRGHTPLGLGLVKKGSPPIDLFIHFGPFFLLTITMLTKEYLEIIERYTIRYWYIGVLSLFLIIFRPSLFLGLFALGSYILAKEEKDKNRKFFLTLLMYAYIVVTGCEILYIRDIYGGGPFYRGNTVFKFYFLSWTLFGISLSYLNFIKKKGIVTIVSLIIITPGLLYLLFGTQARININLPPTLNGIRFIERYYPTDYKIIQYINKNVKGHPGIVEAIGKDGAYTYYGRISTYTGLPTIMGWRMHELVWRGYIPEGDERTKAIRDLYTKDMREKEKLILKYKIHYMILGNLEKRAYGEHFILPQSTEKIKVRHIKIGKGELIEFIY